MTPYPMFMLLKAALICAVLLPSANAIVSGIGVSSGGAQLGYSEDLDLSESTFLEEFTRIEDDSLRHSGRIVGSGSNEALMHTSTSSYSLIHRFESEGDVVVKTEWDLTPSAGLGTLDASFHGSSGTAGSKATLDDREMYLSSTFSGTGGDLDTHVTSYAGQDVGFSGKGSIQGVDLFGSDVLNEMQSNGVVMSIDGLFEDDEGELASFNTMAATVDKSTSKSSATSSIQGASNDDPTAFKLKNWRWEDNPNIQLYVRVDSRLKAEKLDIDETTSAIESAASTWDEATSQQLFAPTVQTTTKLKADKLDGFCVHAFKSFSSKAIGYARTWYYNAGRDDGYYQVLESDVCYNSKFKWANDGKSVPDVKKTYDVETVALHELGHTLGLGDIYDDSYYKSDHGEIMNSYDDLQHELGPGDVNGVQAIYGE